MNSTNRETHIRKVFPNEHVAVMDEKNGLMWAADDIGTGAMSIAEAEKAVAELRLLGHADWRLPTIQELLTVVDYTRHDPAANTDLHRVKSAWYWTATKAAWSAGVRWIVHFGYGGCYSYVEGFRARVRAVRSWSGPLLKDGAP